MAIADDDPQVLSYWNPGLADAIPLAGGGGGGPVVGISSPAALDRQAAIDAYWGANTENASPTAAPPPAYGAADPAGPGPIALPTGPVPTPPEPPMAIASPPPITPAPPMSVEPPPPAAPVNMSRQAIGFEREARPEDIFGPPTASQAADTKRWSDAAARLRPKASGGAGNPDPYGVKAAQRGYLESFDTEKGAITARGNAEEAKILARGEGYGDLARQQQEDAAIQRAEEEDARQRFDQQFDKVQSQLDEVRDRTVDPTAGFHDGGMGILAIVGGVVGGLYQGLSGAKSNPFLDQLNHVIDRNIAMQERQLDRDRQNAGDKLNLLGQQRAAFKDSQIAKLQIRNQMYESVKTSLEAEGARYDSAIAKSNATQAYATVDRAQKQVQLAIASALQNQAAAGAAQQASLQREQLKQYRETYATARKDLIDQGYSPAQAEGEALRQAALMFTGKAPARDAGADLGVPVSRTQREKRGEAQTATDAFNAQMDALKEHPAITGSGLDTWALKHLPQRVAPEANATDQDLKTINTQILQAIGKVAKDADGKPNKVMIEKLEGRFEIHASDTKEMKLQKIEGARQVVNALAAEEGAQPPKAAPDATYLDENGKPVK